VRRLKVSLLVALGIIGGVSVLAVVAFLVLLRTDRGNELVRRRIVAALEGALGPRGKVVVGRLVLSPLGSASLDTLELRDDAGALVLASGPLSARYAVGPLLDRELRLERFTIARPQAHLVQSEDGSWNVGRLFADTVTRPGGPARRSRPWTVTLDSLVLAHGHVTISRPDSLPSLPPRVAQYAGLQLVLGRSFYALGPRAGEFLVHALAADIESPPVLLRHAEGRVQLWADSARVALPAVRLRDTYGSLEGGIGWGAPDAPARLGLLLRADSLAFSDIQWVTALVPDSGGGRAIVRITNGPGRGVTRYAIDSIDAHGTGSRVSGRFVADVGDTVAIRDVDVMLQPLDLRFIHEILRDSVPPAPWDGALRGRVVARGGPLSSWALDPSSLEYEDRRLGGARSRLTVSGRLDLTAKPLALSPLDVTLDSMDIRTAGAIAARADSLRGFVRGGVSLTGPVEDFRFDALDLVITDPAQRVSHVRGAGRMALDTATTWLEAQLIVDSARVATFAPAVTPRRLRGTVAGTFSAAARGDSLAMELALEGEDAYLRLSGATSTDSARLVFKGDALMETFDARRFLVDADLPAHRLTARARIALDGNWSGPSGPLEVTIDSTSELAGLELREGRASLVLEPGGVRIDTLAVESTTGRISAKGHLSRDAGLRDTVRFVAAVDSLAHVAGFLPDSVRASIGDSLGGRLTMQGWMVGSLDTVVVGVAWTGAGLRAGANVVERVTGEIALEGVPRAITGTTSLDAEGLALGGVGITTLAAQGEILAQEGARARLRASTQLTMGDTLRAQLHGAARLHHDSLRVTLDTLRAVTREADWTLVAPATLYRVARRLATDTVALRSTDGASVRFAVALDTTGPVSGFAGIERLPLRHARFTGTVPEGLDGLLSLDATLGGTRAAPTLEVAAALDSGLVRDRPQPALALEGRYADRRFTVDLRGRSGAREDFALTGTLPVDLRLQPLARERRLHDDEEIYLRFVASGYSLVALNSIIPGVTDVEGGIDADLLVGGTWGNYQPRGSFLLRDGAFTVPTLQARFRDLAMDVALAPDTVILHRVRLADELAANDTATLQGVVAYLGDAWHADLTSMARNLHVIDNPRLAEADVSWQLALRGRLDSLALTGSVVVPTATAHIADNRDVVLLEEDLVAAAQRRRYMPRLEALTVRLGNEVRLRSAEMNVQLTGEFEVAGTLEAPDVQGEIQATRGSYRLNLGLLQRTFQVDSGVVRLDGVMRPDGTSDNPPRIDIHASYLVRQADREDVRIGARITGTTQEPVVTLASTDLGTTANETEIISYMLFGAPSFALDDRSSSAVRAATAALVPSLGGAVETLLGGQVPWIDDLQVTTVAGDSPSDFSLNSFEGLLNSFALMAGKQVGPDGYLSMSTGVCRGENRAARSLPMWFGFTAEYRPRERLSAQLSLSPGSSPCNRIGTINQIYQVGLDLFRDWRW
jgi:translocation and assembly module TamB